MPPKQCFLPLSKAVQKSLAPTAIRLSHSLVVEADAKKFESNFPAYMSWLISIAAKDLPEISFHCERCGVCAFLVHCSYPDGYKSGVSCLHAHAVATFVTKACSDQCVIAWKRESRTLIYPHKHVKKQDKAKEQYQVTKGIQPQPFEIDHTVVKSNSGDLLKQWNNILRDAMKKLPSEMIDRKTLARRPTMQSSGASPKPSKIQHQYKSRSKLKAEKGRKYIDVLTMRNVGMDRKKLHACYIFTHYNLFFCT
ncbi:hypothetical protein Aduo_018860 [Ancylostoma duodenale]